MPTIVRGGTVVTAVDTVIADMLIEAEGSVALDEDGGIIRNVLVHAL